MHVYLYGTGPQGSDAKIPISMTVEGEHFTGSTGGGTKITGYPVFSDKRKYGPLPGILSGGISYDFGYESMMKSIPKPGLPMSPHQFIWNRSGIKSHGLWGSVGCAQWDNYPRLAEKIESILDRGERVTVSVIPYGHDSGAAVAQGYGRGRDEERDDNRAANTHSSHRLNRQQLTHTAAWTPHDGGSWPGTANNSWDVRGETRHERRAKHHRNDSEFSDEVAELARRATPKNTKVNRERGHADESYQHSKTANVQYKPHDRRDDVFTRMG
jgi:hypothetical protein